MTSTQILYPSDDERVAVEMRWMTGTTPADRILLTVGGSIVEVDLSSMSALQVNELRLTLNRVGRELKTLVDEKLQRGEVL